MAAKNKTSETEVSVADFLDSFVQDDQKKKDSLVLLELMEKWSGYRSKMWGPSIIGFGKYHYKYPSGHEGEAPLIGFSPRKAEFSLYVVAQGHNNKIWLDKLGKYKMGKSCIYFKRLADLDLKVFEDLCIETIKYLHENPDTKCQGNK